jgi:hypothetical protein
MPILTKADQSVVDVGTRIAERYHKPLRDAGVTFAVQIARPKTGQKVAALPLRRLKLRKLRKQPRPKLPPMLFKPHLQTPMRGVWLKFGQAGSLHRKNNPAPCQHLCRQRRLGRTHYRRCADRLKHRRCWGIPPPRSHLCQMTQPA